MKQLNETSLYDGKKSPPSRQILKLRLGYGKVLFCLGIIIVHLVLIEARATASLSPME